MTTRAMARTGLVAIALIVSGCIQRGAPIEVVGSPPPQQRVTQFPQQQPPPLPRSGGVPTYQTPRSAQPFPTIGSDLPPPNANPMVQDVGSPRQPQISPRPVPRPAAPRPFGPDLGSQARAGDTPFTPLDFGGTDPDLVRTPQRPDQDVVEEELPEPDAPARPAQPRASDDYATLVGDSRGADSSARPNTAAGGETPPAAAAGEKVLVALLVPESDRRGSVRAIADGLAKAAALAASDFNEPRLVLRKYDTGGDPRKAADAAKKALADGATLMIGPLFSGSAAAVRPIAQSAGVSVIAFTTDESVLGGGLYSIGFLPQTEISRIISYAGSKGRRNIAVLAPDSPYGGVITSEARSTASRVGAKIVRVQPFKDNFESMDVTATDFAEYYQSAPKVDALLMPTNGRTLQGLGAYLAYRDVLPTKIKYMGLGLWDDKETFREATLRGGWFPGVDPALKADFNYRFSRAYGGDAPSISYLGYDAVAVAASLLKASGGGAPFGRQSILSPSGFTGMSGLFRFRADGRNDRALSILEVGQQQFRVVDPAPSDFSGLAGG